MTKEETRMLEVVTAMREENIRNRRFPTFSLLREVRDRLRGESGEKLLETARKLEESGRLKIGRTLNDFYFEIVEPEDTSQTEDAETTEEISNQQQEQQWQQA